MDWVLEDILKFDCKFVIDDLQICLEWILVEDSLYILIVCVGNEVFIFGCVLRIVNIFVRGESFFIGKEIWLFFYSVYLIFENKWQLLIRVLFWIRNGVFVVGFGIEMQVYLQWRVFTDGIFFFLDIMIFVFIVILQKVSEVSRGGVG